MSRIRSWTWAVVPALAACGVTDRTTGVGNPAAPAPLANLSAEISLATMADPFTVNLYAGKSIGVGDIEVWNDATTLHVRIVVDAGWCMTESHVAVASQMDGIPQTRTGNPVPGQFAYGDSYDPCANQDDFEIPLAGLGLTPLIAVHAKVWDKASETTDTYYSAAGQGVVFGPLSAYADLSGDWGIAGTPVATYVHGSWPHIPGATWISTHLWTEDPVSDSWRRFQRTVAVPGYPVSGEIAAVTSDNAEEFYHNGVLVGSDGEVQGPFTDNFEWSTVVTYPFTPVAGANVLDFIVRNYAQDGGTYATNPTGLIYTATVSYYARNESAWAGTVPGQMPFPGKNWATYFTYGVTHGVMSNQDENGAAFPTYGSTGYLKFFALEGTSGDLGDLDWKFGDISNPTIAFTGNIISATRDVTGVWALLVDLTNVTATGGTTISDGCTITFFVQSGSPGSVHGWTWGTEAGCAYGSSSGGPFGVTSGLVTEF